MAVVVGAKILLLRGWINEMAPVRVYRVLVSCSHFRDSVGWFLPILVPNYGNLEWIIKDLTKVDLIGFKQILKLRAQSEQVYPWLLTQTAKS